MAETLLQEVETVELFPAETVARWREQVEVQRELLFRQNWKNRRQVVPLRSKAQEDSFRFVVEWCEEYDEVVGRTRERGRLDKLKALGIDVNTPREELPEELA